MSKNTFGAERTLTVGSASYTIYGIDAVGHIAHLCNFRLHGHDRLQFEREIGFGHR